MVIITCMKFKVSIIFAFFQLHFQSDMKMVCREKSSNPSSQTVNYYDHMHIDLILFVEGNIFNNK